MLFARDGLVYREYEDAIRAGDTGRIEKVIRYWALLYQGTNLSNYPQEMIHLVACLLKIWGEDIRDMWLDNCLVNMVGRTGAWLPLDLFCEYVIRELKARRNPASNHLGGNFWEKVLARQIMTMLTSKQQMYRETNATTGGTRTTHQDTEPNVRMVFESLQADEACVRTRNPLGRYMAKQEDIGGKASLVPAAIDFIANGMRRIETGEPLKKYKKSSRAVWGLGSSYAALDDEEEEDPDDSPGRFGGSGLAGGDLDDDL